MADNLIRDIPLIKRRCRQNEAQDMRFAGFLKQRLSMPNAELDAIVRETTDDVWKKIDCLACGNCCKTLQIVVDDTDIKRIAAHLGIAPRQFEAQHVRIAPDRTKHFVSSPCRFLGSDNKCAIYDVRPQACRDFPYLHSSGFRKRVLVTLENATMCPIVYNVWQRLKARFWPNI